MNVREQRLLQSVHYYRQLHFFEQYNDLSDTELVDRLEAVKKLRVILFALLQQKSTSIWTKTEFCGSIVMLIIPTMKFFAKTTI